MDKITYRNHIAGLTDSLFIYEMIDENRDIVSRLEINASSCQIEAVWTREDRANEGLEEKLIERAKRDIPRMR